MRKSEPRVIADIYIHTAFNLHFSAWRGFSLDTIHVWRLFHFIYFKH